MIGERICIYIFKPCVHKTRIVLCLGSLNLVYLGHGLGTVGPIRSVICSITGPQDSLLGTQAEKFKFVKYSYRTG